ncbi:MAG: response regulator [Prosthecobacter sp.]
MLASLRHEADFVATKATALRYRINTFFIKIIEKQIYFLVMNLNIATPARSVGCRILFVTEDQTIEERVRLSMALECVDHRTSSSVLLNSSAQSNIPDRSGGGLTELVCLQDESAMTASAEAALNDHRPYALVFVDGQLLHGKDYRQLLRQLWRVQRDLHVVIHGISQMESPEHIPVELDYPNNLLLLRSRLAPFEMAQLIRTLTGKHETNRKTLYRDLDLKAELLEAVRSYEDVCSKLRSEQDHRSQLEEKLCRKQRLETLGRFTAAMAHFFNNYLTVVQGRLSIASGNTIESPALRTSLQDLVVATKRAANVTSQFVAFNRREYLDPKPTDIVQLIESQASLLRQVIGESITVDVSHWANLPLVEADPACLEQCMFNLLLHSKDAMPQGGKLTIQLRGYRVADSSAAAQSPAGLKPGDYVLISIADTGMGMPPSELARLLDSNTLLEDSDEGADIALILAQSMVRLQGGWLAADSVPGTGTEFRIYLPVSEGSEMLPPAERKRTELTKVQESSTILIVDDEESVRQVMEYVLTNQGHNVLVASDSNEAWKLWRSRSSVIQLVITDIQLPGGANGFDLEQAIKDSDPTMPVVFTCGYCPENLGNAKELKVGENFLPKPFGMVELLKIVGHALQRTAKL